MITPQPASEWREGAVGIFTGIPHQKYLNAAGVSNSSLLHMQPTPAHFQDYLKRKEDEQPSAALIVGTLIHHAILTPDEPAPQIAVKPEDMTFRTKEGKAWKAEQEAAGKIILGADAWATVERCVKSALNFQLLVDIVKDSLCEVSCWKERLVSVVVEDDEPPRDIPILCKCRFDILPANDQLVLDIKTTEDASPEEWERSIEKRGYHRQAAWYLDILGEDRAWFFGIIEKPTGFCRIAQLVPAAIEAGRKENERDLKRLAWCVARNEWPGYSVDGTDVCNLPRRYYYKASA